jgi:hypothetical protein
MAYDDDIVTEARRLVVWHGYTPAQASAHFDGRPAASTVDSWARSERHADEDERTWYEQREDTMRERVHQTSPQEMARLTIGKIHEVLTQPGWDANKGDQIAKLSKHLRHFVEPRYHVAMTLRVLTRFLQFVQEEYPEAAGPELVRAVRDFKAQERSKLEG